MHGFIIYSDCVYYSFKLSFFGVTGITRNSNLLEENSGSIPPEPMETDGSSNLLEDNNGLPPEPTDADRYSNLLQDNNNDVPPNRTETDV